MNKRFIILLISGLIACLAFDFTDVKANCSLTEIKEELIISDLDTDFYDRTHYQSAISASSTDFCIPRPTSFSGPSRIQSNGKRHLQSYRLTSALMTGGKSVNLNITSFYKSDYFRIPSGLSENTRDLIRLGKLII